MMLDLLREFRTGVQSLSWARFSYPRFAGAIILSLIGALTFRHFNMPLPWMLGPMAFTTVAAIVKMPIDAPSVVRPPVVATIGVMLGSSFKPELLDQIVLWTVPLLGLAVCLVISGTVCVTYLRTIGKLDPVTAYYAGVPGGMSDMIALADHYGADSKTVALVHASRGLLIIFGLPFLLQLFGADIGGRQSIAVFHEFTLLSLLWLVATVVVGTIVGHLLRLPAKVMLGSMLVSVIAHVTGLSDSSPPTVLLNAAQLVMGATIGCRFLGAPAAETLRVLGISIGSAALLLASTFGCAYAVSRVSAYDVTPLILAYSPGGLAEMSLLALALHIEVAFVSAHHIMRLFLIIGSMVGLSHIFMRRKSKEED